MKAIVALASVLLLLLINGSAESQTMSGPGGRNKPGFVYDSARKKFVLFGGFGKRGEGVRGDTWEWDGAKWNEIKTPAGPTARGGVPSMTYDTHRKKVILFGGWDETCPLDDIWEWNGSNWKRLK